jgi:mannose-6-phosphate isomerase-like protein (cupin superfamily)
MRLGAGYVVASEALEAKRSPDDTAETRVAVDAAAGSEHLEQRIVRFLPGRSLPQELDGREGVLYVVDGVGAVEVGGRVYGLRPEMGAYFAGESFVVNNPGPRDLLTVLVTAPAPPDAHCDPDGRTVSLSDREDRPAGTDRQFRVLVHSDKGCPNMTQFVGVIPPGRAPDHNHEYDEVVYVLEGEGTLHIEEESHPIGPGTCMHLPPKVVHALENESDVPMRVLGVFHPAGDPAAFRSYEAAEQGGLRPSVLTSEGDAPPPGPPPRS